MPEEYTKEELRKLLEKLPEELKEALFSEKVTDAIFNVCERNEIPDEKISEVSKLVGEVFLGLLPLEEFMEALEKRLRLSSEVARKVHREIFRFVFYPVKEALTSLYKAEIKPPTGMKVPKEEIEKKPEALKKEDIYREQIE